MAPDKLAMLTVHVRRAPGPDGLQRFAVERRDSQTVLDVVTQIQREQDPTLAYRFACRVGMCGSCAMTVNGRPRWTCRTRVVEALGRQVELVLEPLAHFPVVKDLAVDMQAFFEKWREAKGYFEPGVEPVQDFTPVRPDSAQRQEADRGIECINCGICYAACDVVGWKPEYLGPAALNRAWTLTNDIRDKGQKARDDAVLADAGCHACHTHMSCTTFCPKHLEPTFSIAGLKRRSLRRALGRQT
jgi:fumarate reductase iron-sulfur subunit